MYDKRLKLSLIVTSKHVDLSKWGLFLKSLIPFCRRIYAFSFDFKMKALNKSIFQCWDKDQLNFYHKNYGIKQPLIFTVYLMNHVFLWCTFSDKTTVAELHLKLEL